MVMKFTSVSIQTLVKTYRKQILRVPGGANFEKIQKTKVVHGRTGERLLALGVETSWQREYKNTWNWNSTNLTPKYCSQTSVTFTSSIHKYNIYYTTMWMRLEVSSECLCMKAPRINKEFFRPRLGICNRTWFLHLLQCLSWNISRFFWHSLMWLSWRSNSARERKKENISINRNDRQSATA